MSKDIYINLEDIISKFDTSKLSRDYIKEPLKLSNTIKTEKIKKLDLEYLYITLNLKVTEIALYFNCGIQTINRHIKKYNIKKDFSLKLKNMRKTNLIKYGDENYTYSKKVLEKRNRTNLERYGNINVGKINSFEHKKSMIEKYGVDNPSKVKEIVQKRKNTNMERYGSVWGNINKYKQNILKKHGVSNVMQIDNIKRKNYESRKRNGNASSSKPAEEIYKLLLTKFKVVIKEYTSNLYPFSCDFYIPEKDLYIEYQGCQMHGGEPYNPENPNHISLVEKYKRKAEEINFKGQKKTQYLHIIDVWTIKDPLKRETAKTNGLNWIEFFNMEQFMIWFNKL